MAQRVLFDTGRRRTRPGIMKIIEEAEPSQDDTDQPLLLVPKILPVSEGTGVTSLFNFHSRVLMCFHAPSRPRKMDKFLFFSYRNTYKIRHYKKDNGNPTINYFIYEFHSNRNTCPTETEFVTCYPLA